MITDDWIDLNTKVYNTMLWQIFFSFKYTEAIFDDFFLCLYSCYK